MPPIRIQANAELEIAAVVDGRVEVILLQHLGAVEPELVEARAVRFPAGLDLDLVPGARGDGGQVGEGLDVLRADGALLHARVELVPH